jgi:hypothetical protein
MQIPTEPSSPAEHITNTSDSSNAINTELHIEPTTGQNIDHSTAEPQLQNTDLQPPTASTRSTTQRRQTLIPSDTIETDWDNWGDSLISAQNPICRIVLQNANGVCNKATILGHRASELQLSIIGLVKTNVDWKCQIPSTAASKTAITKILRQFWKRTIMSFSSSDHF